MAFRSLRFFVPLALTAGFLAPWGCSAAKDDNTFDPSGGNDTTGTLATTTAGSGGSGGSGGSSSDGVGGFNFGGNSGTGGSTVDPDAACIEESAATELVPLDIIILLDRSGSMSGSNWTGSINALQTFVNDPASSGISVGLLYFPAANLQGTTSCNYTLYDNLIVPVGELPANAQALTSSLTTEQPTGPDTPMYGALKGALFAATAYQDANPNHKVILVFASDGDPNGCASNENQIPTIASLAQSALNYNGVQTYVVAISGANLANLNQIAAAGGTTSAYDVTGNINLFSQKMAEIRANAVSCEFLIPDPPEGETLDPNAVTVRFTDSSGAEVPIPRAMDASQCGVGPGWYYDNNITPTKIFLCPASCEAAQNDLQATLRVYFGCKGENPT